MKVSERGLAFVARTAAVELASLPWASIVAISRRTEPGLASFGSGRGVRGVSVVMKAASMWRPAVPRTNTRVSTRYWRWNWTFGISVSSVYRPS